MTDRFNAELPLYDNVCDGVALNDYRLLAESGRYPGRSGPSVGPPLFARLAAFIAGRGGERRDRPIYELCHLVAALADSGIRSEGERLNLLLGLDPVTPAKIREAVSCDEASSDVEGLVHETGEAHFVVHYRRAVYLFAVHEFLAQMEGCDYFGELNDVFEGMLVEGADEAAIRNASNAIARRLARYRHVHFDWSMHAENFAALARFLNKREAGDQWHIEDETIFDFWCEASKSGRYREYRTCFDAFVQLMRTLERAVRIRKAEGVKSLEQDFERGLEAVADVGYSWEEAHWDNPLALFDTEVLQEIKFFKTASEGKPLEDLMKYGPQALELVHAFLRLETFAAIQSAIGNDLRVDRGRASISRRLEMEDAASYREKQFQLQKLLDHVHELMKAVLHVIGSADLPADAREDAERAFKGMRRKGFEAIDDLDTQRREAFKIAADRLPAISRQLDAFLARVEQLGDQAFLNRLFEKDKGLFQKQFLLLYGNST
jgi:hypothetical protein